MLTLDCDDIDAGVNFWSKALGAMPVWRDDPADPYVSLGEVVDGLTLLPQRVPEPKSAKLRLHIDIETDDLAAEVARLERLGARRQAQIEDWWVMEDPCGNEFCVVPRESESFSEHANTWTP